MNAIDTPQKTQPKKTIIQNQELSSRFIPDERWLSIQYSHEQALSGLTNHLGSFQIEADPIAIKHIVFPPISAGEETTGITTLDGDLLILNGKPVEVHWTPHAVKRRMEHKGWLLETTTAAVPDEKAVVIRVQLTNQGSKPRKADLRIRFSGRGRNTGQEGYNWWVPQVSTTVFLLCNPEGLDVIESFDPNINAVVFHNLAESCCTVQGIIGPNMRWENSRAVLQLDVKPGETVPFHVLMLYGAERQETRQRYLQLVQRSPEALLQDSQKYWEYEYQRAEESCVQHLREEVAGLKRLSPSLTRIYQYALITALYLKRNHPSQLDHFYLTLGPRRGEAWFVFWDIGMAAPMMGYLDPLGVGEMVEYIAKHVDLYAHCCVDVYQGKSAMGFYSASPWSVFRMAWAKLCGTKDLSWLDKPLNGMRKGQTVLHLLEELALAWTTATPGQEHLTQRTRAPGVDPLAPSQYKEMPTLRPESRYPFKIADIGHRGNILECNTYYEHQVASMNAGYVWMMRRLAELHDTRGNAQRAQQLRSLAKQLSEEILKLYRPEDGFFSCGQPDGSIRPSRVGLDHLMVMVNMPEDLSETIRQGLVASFQRELQSPAWMACVSPQDPDVVSGYRADCSFPGCYAGFVAMMAEGLCNIGQEKLVQTWLEKASAVTAQGPYGQAYWLETLRPPIHGGPCKATDEFPQGNHWVEMGGAAFGSTIIHGILGKKWTPF